MVSHETEPTKEEKGGDLSSLNNEMNPMNIELPSANSKIEWIYDK